MSGPASMRAEFRLDLAGNLGSETEHVIQLMQKLEAALGRVGGVDPFDNLWTPIERCETATAGLNETLGETAAAMGAAAETGIELGEALGKTGASAVETGEALTEMAVAAERASTRAVAAAKRIHEAFTGASGGGGFGGYAGGVRASGAHFHESVERGIGRAFGAAAAGFGLIEPVHAAGEFDNTLTHIGIGLGYEGDANRAFVGSYGQQLNQLARQTGQRGTDLADAAGFFSREGYSNRQLAAVMPVVAHIGTAYDAPTEAVAKSTFALQENMHIGDRDLAGALASVALAGKQADLPFEKLAPLLPQVAAQAGALGVQGRSGVDDLSAALAVVRKSTGTEGEAVTNTRAFLQAITSPHTAHRFAQFGVNLFGVEDNARARGLDPMMAVLHQVDRITQRGTNTRALGTLFNNQEDRSFVTAILQHMDQYFSIHDRVSHADPGMLGTDFRTGMTSTTRELTSFEESLHQIERLVGDGFVPVLHGLTIGLHGVIDATEWLNKNVPGAVPVILGVTGTVLALAAGCAALGAVAGPLVAGFELVGAVFAGITAAGTAVAASMAIVAVGIGLAGYEIYQHWGEIRAGFTEFGHWMAAWGAWVVGEIEKPFLWIEQHVPNWMQPSGASPTPTPMVRVHVSHDAGLNVHARSSSRVPVTTQRVPGTGRTVNRP